MTKRPFKLLPKTELLPESLQPETTKQKIYKFLKENPGSLQRDISKAVKILDTKEPLNEMEAVGVIFSKVMDCCNAKRWYLK